MTDSLNSSATNFPYFFINVTSLLTETVMESNLCCFGQFRFSGFYFISCLLLFFPLSTLLKKYNKMELNRGKTSSKIMRSNRASIASEPNRYGLDLATLRSWSAEKTSKYLSEESSKQEIAVAKVRAFLDAISKSTYHTIPLLRKQIN